MPDAPEAQDVMLRKLSRLAPPFHRHIAPGKLLGKTCRVGDHVVVYQVTATTPPGRVRVTDKTVLHFE